MPERIAGAIDEFGLHNARKWNTQGGTIKRAVKVLAKAGPTAGHADWAATYDIGHRYHNIGTALRIPHELHIGFYRDSLLYSYNEGKNSEASNALILLPHQH